MVNVFVDYFEVAKECTLLPKHRFFHWMRYVEASIEG